MYPDFDTPLPVKILAALLAMAVIAYFVVHLIHSTVSSEEVHALRHLSGK